MVREAIIKNKKVMVIWLLPPTRWPSRHPNINTEWAADTDQDEEKLKDTFAKPSLSCSVKLSMEISDNRLVAKGFICHSAIYRQIAPLTGCHYKMH